MSAWDGPPRHAVVIASGGLADAVLAYWLTGDGVQVTLLSVDDGQARRTALHCAARLAHDLGCEHDAAVLPGLANVLGRGGPAGARCAAADPHHSMSVLGLAVGHAAAGGADAVAYAAHGGASAAPGSSAEFVTAYQEAMAANTGRLRPGIRVLAPFADIELADIVELGAGLHVPFGRTWSCYSSGDVHCGRCAGCAERRAAFVLARVADPTLYAAAAVLR